MSYTKGQSREASSNLNRPSQLGPGGAGNRAGRRPFQAAVDTEPATHKLGTHFSAFVSRRHRAAKPENSFRGASFARRDKLKHVLPRRIDTSRWGGFQAAVLPQRPRLEHALYLCRLCVLSVLVFSFSASRRLCGELTLNYPTSGTTNLTGLPAACATHSAAI
jgi:hypothetical protein